MDLGEDAEGIILLGEICAIGVYYAATAALVWLLSCWGGDWSAGMAWMTGRCRRTGFIVGGGGLLPGVIMVYSYLKTPFILCCCVQMPLVKAVCRPRTATSRSRSLQPLPSPAQPAIARLPEAPTQELGA